MHCWRQDVLSSRETKDSKITDFKIEELKKVENNHLEKDELEQKTKHRIAT